MNMYMIPVRLEASLYIKATSEDDARRVAAEQGRLLLISCDPRDGSQIPFSGECFKQSPTISISPAMTLAEIPLDHIELSDTDIDA